MAVLEDQYNDTEIMNIASASDAIKMLDRLSRTNKGRNIQPLDAMDNIKYPHRALFSDYNLQIGDTYFIIPPEFILVTSDSPSQTIVTLRQENTQKLKSGYHKRTIMIDLAFLGDNQINGYKVEGPEGYYYVDGLRQLLAQFKLTPFLPISNELINRVYGIFSVVLQSMVLNTVEGFPNMMHAQLTLQEVNMTPYIELPSFAFKYMIDWDLFRFYYQRILTETHEYKKLQSLPINKNHNNFKLSILNSNAFRNFNDSNDIKENNFLKVITDQVLIDSGTNTNYVTWVDSSIDNLSVVAFQAGYSNILTNIQMSAMDSPTIQFLGGMDTIYGITIETTDLGVVQALEQCRIENDYFTRENIKYRSVGFVKLESELVEFTGSQFVVIETVTTNTVPEFPGLYSIQINFISYDIAQGERENLSGFRPFPCDNEECINNSFEMTHTHTEQAIDQSRKGMKIKAKQDNYAESRIRNIMEVYPDLRLPTYGEVNSFITNCNSFRQSKGLSQLPYSTYPLDMFNSLNGLSYESTSSVELEFDEDGIANLSDNQMQENAYGIFVDPDFYVFYPLNFENLTEILGDVEELQYLPNEREARTKKKIVAEYIDNIVDETDGGSDSTSSNGVTTASADEFASLCEAQVGKQYVWGTAGPNTFDCSGLAIWGLAQVGVLPSGTNHNWGNSVTFIEKAGGDMFKEVPISECRRGDILSSTPHVMIVTGPDSLVEAKGKQYGVVNSQLSERLRNYKADWHCIRPRAFEKGKLVGNGKQTGSSSAGISTTTSISGSDNAEKIWNYFKSKGLNDFAIAGIMGNLNQESGLNPGNLQNTYNSSFNISDEAFVNGLNNGTISLTSQPYYDDNVGFGLHQISWHTLKDDFTAFWKASGKSVDDLGMQLDFIWSLMQAKSYLISALNNTTSVSDATAWFLGCMERGKTYAVSSGFQYPERLNYANSFYNRFKGTSGNVTVSSSFGTSSRTNASINNQTQENNETTITKSEYISICSAIYNECKGEGTEAQTAAAQLIYDRLTTKRQKFGSLPKILEYFEKGTDKPEGKSTKEEWKSIKKIVKDVFSDNKRQFDKQTCKFMVSTNSRNLSYETLDSKYDRLGSYGTHTFWGKKVPKSISDTKFTILDTDSVTFTVGSVSVTKQEHTNTVEYSTFTYDGKYFGRPKLVKFGKSKSITKALNKEQNIIDTMFCDQVAYSRKGRLLKAFPAYLFCILDEDAQWLDGRKLWTNFYTQHSVVDIGYHCANDMPMDTATIVVTNSYHNLSRTQSGLDDYSIENDDEYKGPFGFTRWFYKQTGLLIGLGPKLTDKLAQLHQVIYNNAMLREGARVHLRMGYGSDPLGLAPIINGHISDVTLGDQVTIVVSGDGHELVQHIVSSREKDDNNGFLGLFSFGKEQESSNIIASEMTKRMGWFNKISKKIFEASKYSIEHYGIYFHDTEFGESIDDIQDTLTSPATAILSGGSSIRAAGALEVLQTTTAILSGAKNQTDILKNIYIGNYKKQRFVEGPLLENDGEDNIIFNKYNMTPWDEFQVCTQQVPEYIVKTSYHQFDSRLFFGLPTFMERYRINIINDECIEEVKSSSQVHYIDSLSSIVDNRVKVTNQFTNTNIKVTYTRGSSVVSTGTIHSDDTIDFSKQKTTVLDSPILQDVFGPDAIYEFLGLKIGREAARRVGISNLIYGWQQEYQGDLLLLGNPGIKPNDYILINDSYTHLFGIALVREVGHTFNINMGFTTNVVLGMMTFSTDENSGLINTAQNLLGILSCFASYSSVKQNIMRAYQSSIKVFADLETLNNYTKAYSYGSSFLKDITDTEKHPVVGKTAKVTGAAVNTGVTIFNVKGMFHIIANVIKPSNFKSIMIGVVDGFKTAKSIEKFGKAGLFTGKALGTLKGLGEGLKLVTEFNPFVFIGILVIEAVFDALLEWFSNKNVIVLLPLWYNNYPFVSGVKGGQNILMMGSNATATKDSTPENDDGSTYNEDWETQGL